ncbi:MAG: T9SS type A sorting domain-containing protein [Mariniphaga sp.]|nr:T9SS type A sorting domain-containing protein [Mariniphaga sp.]
MKKRLLILFSFFSVIILVLGFVIQFNKKTEKINYIPPSGPHLAAHRNFKISVDPLEQKIPSERLSKVREMVRLKSAPISEDIIWHEIPANAGGRTRKMMFDPNDHEKKKAWACSSTGGLWFNLNIHNPESPWIPVSDRWESLATNCMTHDPQNSATFYVGTGEGETASYRYRESSGKGAGIYISTNAGESWELLRSTENFEYVNDIVIRIENGISVIYAAVASGFYKGTNHYSQPSEGLFRSADNGKSWTQVLPNISGMFTPYAPADIEVASNGRIFVGTMRNMLGEGGAVILFSDDGINWEIFEEYQTKIKNESQFNNQDRYYNIPGRVILAASPSDANRVYALFESALEEHIYLLGQCYYIIRSDDNGESWTQIPIPIEEGTNFAYIAWHALMAEVDPNNPDNIYVGGRNMWRSGDAGDSWQMVSSTEGFLKEPGVDMDLYVHADIHSLEFLPGSSDTAIVSTDGGLHYATNLTRKKANFREANFLYNTTQYYTCAVHPENSNNYLLGGTQDNSTYYLEGTEITPDSRIMSGDGAYCFIDQDQPNIQIATMQWNYFGLSIDGMKNYNYVGSFYSSGLFINPMDYDSQTNTLYCNAGMEYGYYLDQILIIENLGSNFNGRFVQLNTEGNSPFSAVEINTHSMVQSRILYLGNEKGQVYKVQNPGTNVIGTEISNGLPQAYVSCIETGNSENELIVTYSNYGVKSVWYSPDQGITWFDKEGNLPDIPVRWAITHPRNSNQVLLATESGIWSTSNFLDQDVIWELTNFGMPNIRVDMLKMRETDNYVLAATHGRGMYSTTWDINTNIGQPEIQTSVTIFPNPVGEKLNIESTQKEISAIHIYNLNGQLIKIESANSLKKLTLNVNDIISGEYLIQVLFNNKTMCTEKMIKQ